MGLFSGTVFDADARSGIQITTSEGGFTPPSNIDEYSDGSNVYTIDPYGNVWKVQFYTGLSSGERTFPAGCVLACTLSHLHWHANEMCECV